MEEFNIENENQVNLEVKPKSRKNIFLNWLFKDDNIYGVIGSVFIIGILIGLWYFVNYLIKAFSTYDYNSLIKASIYILFAIPAFLILKYFHDQSDNVKNEKRRIDEERRVLQEKLKKENMDIFNSIQNNLNQLQDYYLINTSQAKKSFFFSMLASVLGLLLIFLGIIFYYFFNDQYRTTITALTTFSGILSQFIGGSYFILYKKSISQLNFFYSQLIKSQDFMLAIDLSESIEDEEKRFKLTENIINSLINKNSNYTELENDK